MRRIDRATLSRFLPNPQAIAAFEAMFKAVDIMPGTIEEAQAVAAQAQATAAAALALLADTLATLEQIAAAPAAQPPTDDGDHAPAAPSLPTDSDDHAPRAHLGTLSAQDADAVSITGGTIDAADVAASKFSCNGKTPQAAYTLGAAATDLPTALTLANNIRAALIANGIGA